MREIIGRIRKRLRMPTDFPGALQVKKEENQSDPEEINYQTNLRSAYFSGIDFAAYLRSLADGNSLGLESSRININFHDVFLSREAAVYCGCIVNGLISECLDNGQDKKVEVDAGAISIDLFEKPHKRFELVILDKGIGFSKNLECRIKEKTGLRLVSLMADQINGTISALKGIKAGICLQFREPKVLESWKY